MMIKRVLRSPKALIVVLGFSCILFGAKLLYVSMSLQNYDSGSSGDDDLFLEYNNCSKHQSEVFADYTTNNLWSKVTNYELIKAQNPNVSKKLLKVIVLPHSHVDPGWLETFKDYYNKKVRDILSIMVEFLYTHEKMTFIWSETSFLERWWNEASSEQHEKFKSLINRGQLEISGGAWVMTDEATPYFWATIDNVIEGHRFIHEKLGVLPRTSWSVDPFGHGLTVPYLMGLAGVKNLVIGRIHSQIKAQIRQGKNLVYNWRQLWDPTTETDALIHVLPRNGYITSQTCGPDGKVCCQFDFGPSSIYRNCKNRPQSITESNVKQYGDLLADQLRKLSADFRHSVLLFPMGSDFKFNFKEDYQLTYDSYTTLFNYINSNEKFQMQLQFGTVSQYFAALEDCISSEEKIHSLSGDFFPYSDFAPKNHWTGYFTTRPFYKRLDRIIQAHLRSADFLYSLSIPFIKGTKHQLEGLSLLNQARREVALFQHHDTITGTSRKLVMLDFLKRLSVAWEQINSVHVRSLSAIMNRKGELDQKSSGAKSTLATGIHSTQIFPSTEGLTSTQVLLGINKGEKRFLTIFNQVAQRRTLPIRLRTTCLSLQASMQNGFQLTVQVNPVLNDDGSFSMDKYEALFLLELGPLGLDTVQLFCDHGRQPSVHFSRVYTSHSMDNQGPFEVHALETGDMASEFVRATFNTKSGSLMKVNDHEVNLTFWEYGSRGGAYHFKPTGEPKAYSTAANRLFKIEGPVVSEFHSFSPQIKQSFAIYHTKAPIGQSFHMSFTPNLKNVRNKDFVFRMKHTEKSTNEVARSESTYYTDAMGLQMVKRRYDDRVPVEGNYFPIASSILSITKESRLSIFTGQPNGGTSSPRNGLEIMIDRVQSQDDGEGLEQAIDESPSSEQHFSLLIEQNYMQDWSNSSFGDPEYHSKLAMDTQNLLLYPEVVFVSANPQDAFAKTEQILINNMPLGWELLHLRPLNETSSLLVLLYRKIHGPDQSSYDGDVVLKVQNIFRV